MHMYSNSLSSVDELLNYIATICLQDRRIPCAILVDPHTSQFETLYLSGNNQSLITIFGLTKFVFDQLVTKFTPYFQKYSPHNSTKYFKLVKKTQYSGGGRPCKVNP